MNSASTDSFSFGSSDLRTIPYLRPTKGPQEGYVKCDVLYMYINIMYEQWTKGSIAANNGYFFEQTSMLELLLNQSEGDCESWYEPPSFGQDAKLN